MSADTAFEVGRLYEPIKRIADALTASQQDLLVRLPGLQAYFPMGIRFANGSVVGHAGAGASLVQTGVCPVGYDGDSFAGLGNGTNYLYTSSGLGITGLETFIEAALRGLTICGWFKVDVSPTSTSGLISKDGLAPQRGYNLTVTSANTVQFVISGNGTALDTVQGLDAEVGQWMFVAGRFIPSTEIAVFVNGSKAVVTASIPSSINVSTQNFEVGRSQNGNSRIITGKARDVVVCSASLSDDLIEEVRVAYSP